MKIKNWHKFQHFKDRRPPWIKLYRDLLEDPDWHEMSGDDAKALVMLWMIASESDGHLPNARKLAFRLRISKSSTEQLLIKLSHWLDQDDISSISDRYQSDTPERERETEDKRKSEGETRARDPVAEMSQKKEVGEKREPLISTEAFLLADDYRKLVGVSDDEIGWVGWPYTVQTWLTQGHGAERILAIGARLAGKSPRMIYHATAVTSELSRPIPPDPAKSQGGANGQVAAYSSRPSGQPWQQRRDAGHVALAKLRATIDAATDGGCEGGGTVIDLNSDARRG